MTTKAFRGGYFAELEDVYHTEEDCPAGRLLPAELRSEGTGGDRIWCPSCRAWENSQRSRMRLTVPE